MKIDVSCETCNTDLTTRETMVNGDVLIEVEPCSVCLMNMRQEGYDEGYAEGFNVGH